MLQFENYFNSLPSPLLNEAVFRKSRKITHLYDLPMFSVFINNDTLRQLKQEDTAVLDYLVSDSVKESFNRARNELIKQGFQAMHANVVFTNLANDRTQSTTNAPGGRAHMKGRYIELDYSNIFNNEEYLTKVLKHEWAHLYLFNGTKELKRAVKTFYDKILRKGKDLYKSQNKEAFYSGEMPITGGHTSTKKEVPDLASFVMNYLYKRVLQPLYIKTILVKQKTKQANTRYTFNTFSKDALNWLNVSLSDLVRDSIYRFSDISPNEKFVSQLVKEINKKLNSIDILQQIYSDVNFNVEGGMFESITPSTTYEQAVQQFQTEEQNDTFLYFGNNRKTVIELYSEIDPGLSVPRLLIKTFIDTGIVDLEKELEGYKSLSGSSYTRFRSQLAELTGWVRQYGFANDEEMWSTGVEDFLKLPEEYRREILHLMQVR